MPHAKLDNGLHDHPKFVALLDDPDGLAAVGLWSLCLSWAHAHTDPTKPDRAGLLPSVIPRRLAGHPVAHLCKLLELNHLWEPAEPAGWRIHDFAEWQEVHLWLQRKEAGKHGAQVRWQQHRTGSQNGANQASAQEELWQPHAGATAGPMPITEQNNNRTEQNKKQTSRAALARFAEFWNTYPRKTGKLAAEKAWAKACLAADPGEIIAGAGRYRDKPGREQRFTAYPATWLNQGRWQDEDEPDVTAGGTWSPP